MNEELKKILSDFVKQLQPLLTEEATEAEEVQEEQTEEATEAQAEESPDTVTREETTVEKVVETVNVETGEETVKRTEESTITFKDGVYYGV